jgi:hypothetical protein
MANIDTWEKELEKLDIVELSDIRDSLDRLLKWDFFRKEYNQTGIPTLEKLVYLEIVKRGEKG